MSIIHDALKKVQQTNNTGVSTPPPPYQEPVRPPEQPKLQDTINIPLLVAALCAVIAMIFAILPQIAPKKTAAPAASASTLEKKQPAPEAAAPAVKTPSSDSMSKAVANAVSTPVMPAIKPAAQKIVDPNDPLSSIQIEGVMDMNGKKVALISGNVYEEGQTIYGKIISEITFDSLTIIEDGRKRIFSTKP